MDRIRNLEDLVKDLTSQLEKARSESGSFAGSHSHVSSPGHAHASEPQDHASPVSDHTGVHEQLGRMVLQDTSHTRYVSSEFWTRVDDEVRLQPTFSLA
jgi:hypothetical protein